MFPLHSWASAEIFVGWGGGDPKKALPPHKDKKGPPHGQESREKVDWLALHLKFGSVYFQQFGGISRPHVDQLQI